MGSESGRVKKTWEDDDEREMKERREVGGAEVRATKREEVEKEAFGGEREREEGMGGGRRKGVGGGRQGR